MEIFGKVVKINEKDNVAVALHDINTGEQIDTGNGIITAREPVPSGHKIAWKDISRRKCDKIRLSDRTCHENNITG